MNLTIDALQAYLFRHYSGRASEQGMFMKLVEEIGEVAEVLNKRAGRKASDEANLQEQLGTELADMIHYIVAIAAINNINLSDIILKKRQNRRRKISSRHRFGSLPFRQGKQTVSCSPSSYRPYKPGLQTGGTSVTVPP